MKNIIFTISLLIAFIYTSAQDNNSATRKERKAEREAARKAEVKSLLENKTFVFDATHALPLGGGSRYLNYDYTVAVNDETVDSYLPYFGVAYRVQYGATESPLDFNKEIEEFTLEEDDEGYIVDFEVDNDSDHLYFTFHISQQGNTTLQISSSNRQSITYFGDIDAPEETEE